jgi:hypothetical protein
MNKWIEGTHNLVYRVECDDRDNTTLTIRDIFKHLENLKFMLDINVEKVDVCGYFPKCYLNSYEYTEMNIKESNFKKIKLINGKCEWETEFQDDITILGIKIHYRES